MMNPMRELVARLLQASGASVVSAGSGAEALALRDQKRPDILISDIGMPGMDGYELLRRMREGDDEKAECIPAVALTAFARSEDRTRPCSPDFSSMSPNRSNLRSLSRRLHPSRGAPVETQLFSGVCEAPRWLPPVERYRGADFDEFNRVVALAAK